MHVVSKVGGALAAVAAAALSVSLAAPAGADTSAQSGDVVIVGSDTVQNAANFVLDGSPGVTGGYNTNGNLNRVVSFDATGDANGRSTYDGNCGTANAATGLGSFCGGTNTAGPNLEPASIILRTGTKPVVRPNGSGAGVKALVLDAPAAAGYQGLPVGSIQIARMSRLPDTTNSAEICSSGSGGTACGGDHVYQIATDGFTMVHANPGLSGVTYNGEAHLSLQQLLTIYTAATGSCKTWNQIDPANASTATIHPLIPQSGSGTRGAFLADLATVNGNVTPTPGSCVRTVQEHDPSGIYQDSSPADAIEPFSLGKLQLINSGYFSSGAGYSGTGFANGAYTPNFLIATTAGNASDGNPNWTATRGMYLVVRQIDLSITAPFQPGSSQPWLTALITSAFGAIRSSTGQSEIAQAGFTFAYKDCGINPTSC